MSGTYKCPRCGGKDIYFAKRQRISGLGGIYGNRAKMVKTALCKECGENADFTADPADVTRLIKIISFVAAGIILLVVLAIWANQSLATL